MIVESAGITGLMGNAVPHLTFREICFFFLFALEHTNPRNIYFFRVGVMNLRVGSARLCRVWFHADAKVIVTVLS